MKNIPLVGKTNHGKKKSIKITFKKNSSTAAATVVFTLHNLGPIKISLVHLVMGCS